jgi:hypothetical protein
VKPPVDAPISKAIQTLNGILKKLIPLLSLSADRDTYLAHQEFPMRLLGLVFCAGLAATTPSTVTVRVKWHHAREREA